MYVGVHTAQLISRNSPGLASKNKGVVAIVLGQCSSGALPSNSRPCNFNRDVGDLALEVASEELLALVHTVSTEDLTSRLGSRPSW